ncbi:MAG: ATP-dependent DNA helicase [Gammaproteobacteria bacterium]|nr:ATP-dependent DNA helicase [Gammaproteobacteria bacterium]
MRIGVKELAEFVHRKGDLHYRYQSSTLAEEGIARQKDYQESRGGSYQREVRVSATFGDLEISGRIDGWDPEARLVEEVKTTRVDPKELHAHAGDANLAQLRLYGAMLVLADESLDGLRLRLVYLHPTRPGETTFEETAHRDELIGYFETTCAIFAAWITTVRERLAERDRQLAALNFPYGDFRADQRRVAKHLFRAFRDGEHWLVEAPTGSGKTMAGLFAALKAMGAGALDRLAFLTSRTTGQRAAEEALADVVEVLDGEPALSAVTVTAKDRICFNPGAPCDPGQCDYAKGYYDRMPAARRQLLGGGLVRRADVEVAAREHRVCPFELSVDVMAWSDVVVGDYNYVFDPVVRLGRVENPPFSRVGLIVDEAHQLGDRVRDMLGATLSRRSVKSALDESGLPEPLARCLRSIDRALAALGSASSSEQVEIPKPAALLRALDRLSAAVTETAVDLQRLPASQAAVFEAGRFGHLSEIAREGTVHYTASGTRRELAVQLVCTVPGHHIRECMARFHGSARVSGSLTPAGLFQRIHGAAEPDNVVVSPGCFPPENLGVYLVTDISTYYRDRQRTLPRVAEVIEGVCSQTGGNYLVALPSFEYANAVAGAMEGVADCRCQRPGMSLAERDEFIAWLSERNTGRTGIVVMGGVFAESVDFDGGALDGVIVVGAGLPPQSLERDLVAADNVKLGIADDGDEIAYRQPAMTRVVQAVGRVVRSVEDRGVAVLIDPRFARPAYRAFMPARWQTGTVRSDSVAAELGVFWFGESRMRARDGQARALL